MNTPETINIEKYAEALNNLVGMDIGYLGESDDNVNAIVEVIRAAKKLENRVNELEVKLNGLKTSIIKADEYLSEGDFAKGITLIINIVREINGG